MPTAKLIIQDEVNVQLRGLDPGTMDACIEELTFYVPGYIHMPKFKLGWWDGKVRLMKKSGSTLLNLIGDAEHVLKREGYELDIEDHRNWVDNVSPNLSYIDNTYLSEFTGKDGNPLSLWDHQTAAVNTAIEQGQGILEMATGAGKTVVCGIMAKIWQEFGHVVIIVPNIDLALQTQYEFKERIGLDCGIWYGERKERKQTTIGTWQSIDHFPELFGDVVAFIVDEVHQAKANVLHEMLTGPAANVPFRFGCTGTLPKEELFRKQIYGSIGNPIYQVKSKDLQDLGILADATIYQMKLHDSKNPTWIKRSGMNEMWKDELDLFFALPDRLKYVAGSIEEIVTSYGNTLVLVQYRAHGKKLAELLPDAISLDGRNKNRMETYEEFNKGDNNILICTYGIASTGIDIPRIFNLVIIEPGKKFEKVIQTLGRGLRKAEDKQTLNVFDICSDDGLSKKHATARRKLFKEAKQTMHVIDVEYYEC
jgi:superfamily II DNA or RNA helicase